MLFAVGRVASQLEASRASSGVAASTSAASHASAEHTGQVRHKFLLARVSYRANTYQIELGIAILWLQQGSNSHTAPSIVSEWRECDWCCRGRGASGGCPGSGESGASPAQTSGCPHCRLKCPSRTSTRYPSLPWLFCCLVGCSCSLYHVRSVGQGEEGRLDRVPSFLKGWCYRTTFAGACTLSISIFVSPEYHAMLSL